MNEKDTTSQDARQLSDEELSGIAGGYWDYEEEQKFQAQWQKLKDADTPDLLPYEEWINNELAEYDAWAIQDRQYWIAAGCPTDRSYANHGGRR